MQLQKKEEKKNLRSSCVCCDGRPPVAESASQGKRYSDYEAVFFNHRRNVNHGGRDGVTSPEFTLKGPLG